MKILILTMAALAFLAACAAAPPPVPPSPPPAFTAEDKWEHAGYNSDEIVYTILITNQGDKILRCTTHMQGYYFDNGKKTSIADQQLSTVFPAQQTKAGIWLNMDQQSGASYNVHCKPV